MPKTVSKLNKEVDKIKNLNKLERSADIGNLITLINEKKKKESLSYDDLSELLRLYKHSVDSVSKSIKADENKLSANQTDPKNKKKTEEELEKRRKLRRTLAKDYKAILGAREKFSDDKPVKLEDIFENSRATKKEIDISEIKKSAGGINVRLVLPLGKKKVYFTESKPTKSFEDSINGTLDSEIKDFGSNAAFLMNQDCRDAIADFVKGCSSKTIDNLRNIKDTIGMNTTDKIKNEFRKAFDQDAKLEQKTEKLFNMLDKPGKVLVFVDAIDKLAKAKFAERIRNDDATRTGAKQDKRNSAMSTVADLLGCPDVICHSENLNVVVKDKNKVKGTIKGTAMDEAIGDDVHNLSYDCDFYNLYTEDSVKDNTKLMSQIADIQVLDFICGNTDRHFGNLMYGFDKNGKLTLQAFDNDTSFTNKNEMFDNWNGTVDPSGMRMINKKTADLIDSLNMADFKLMLYGFDLTEKEVENAAERLKTMKDTVAESRKAYRNVPEGEILEDVPRIVDEKNLSKYKITGNLAYSADKIHYNQFENIGNRIPENKAGILVGSSRKAAAECRMDLTVGAAARTEDYQRRVDGVVHWYTKGSPQFDAIRNELNKLQELQMNGSGNLMHNKIDSGKVSGVELNEDGKKLKEQLLALKRANKTYLDGKVKDTKKDKVGSRAWSRYNIVRDLDKEVDRQLKELEKLEKATQVIYDFSVGKMRKPTGVSQEVIRAEAKRIQALDGTSDPIAVNKAVSSFREAYESRKDWNFSTRKERAEHNKLFAAAEMGEGFLGAEGKKMSEIEKSPELLAKFKKGVAACIAMQSIGNTKSAIFDETKQFGNSIRNNDIEKYADTLYKSGVIDGVVESLKKKDAVPIEKGSVGKLMAKYTVKAPWNEMFAKEFRQAASNMKNKNMVK